MYRISFCDRLLSLLPVVAELPTLAAVLSTLAAVLSTLAAVLSTLAVGLSLPALVVPARLPSLAAAAAVPL